MMISDANIKIDIIRVIMLSDFGSYLISDTHHGYRYEILNGQ